jgi:hypothetical protein
MLKRILFILTLCCAIAYAADPSSVAPATSGAPANPPSEASIKQLLEVAQAHKLIDNMMAQMQGLMKNAMQQATQGQTISPQLQKEIDKRQAEMMSGLKEVLDWSKLEPIYVRVYQKSFSQQEVDGMITFYKTPTGQALLTKMPLVMQNTMAEMQPLMQPMLQRIQRMQQEIVAELQSEKAKKDG